MFRIKGKESLYEGKLETTTQDIHPRAKKMLKKDNIVENLGKNIQNLKIF